MEKILKMNSLYFVAKQVRRGAVFFDLRFKPWCRSCAMLELAIRFCKKKSTLNVQTPET
jgi:hypothetical protein